MERFQPLCLHITRMPGIISHASFPSHASRALKPLLWNLRHSSDKALAGMHQTPIIDELWKDRLATKYVVSLDSEDEGPAEILTKTPSMSKTVVKYNFKSNPGLRDLYKNPWGYVRHGRVMEDLDALAGNVAFKHCFNETSAAAAPLLVTATVDNMRILSSFPMDTDLRLEGEVAWVGRSSLVINLRVEAEEEDGSPVGGGGGGGSGGEGGGRRRAAVIDAHFKYVARHARTGRAAAVNRLAPETPEERERFARVAATEAALRRRRAAAAAEGGDGGGGGAGEREEGEKAAAQRAAEVAALRAEAAVHLDMPALADGAGSLPLRRTRMESNALMQPQNRNLSGRVFGGFLMRKAYELAFSSCYTFCGARPRFLELERVMFRQPVDVGNLVKFVSHVTYVHPGGGPGDRVTRPVLHVEVEALVVRPEARASVVTNVFNFTFSPDLPGGGAGAAGVGGGEGRGRGPAAGGPLKRVLPLSPSEVEKYLRGRDFVADNLVTP